MLPAPRAAHHAWIGYGRVVATAEPSHPLPRATSRRPTVPNAQACRLATHSALCSVEGGVAACAPGVQAGHCARVCRRDGRSPPLGVTEGGMDKMREVGRDGGKEVG